MVLTSELMPPKRSTPGPMERSNPTRFPRVESRARLGSADASSEKSGQKSGEKSAESSAEKKKAEPSAAKDKD